MINRLTFANVIKILLENKKKTFTQYRMVYCIFSKCMNDTVTSADLIGDGMIQISRWCSGERPIPKNVLEKYEENDYWNDMEEDFRTKIIPNLINELQVRSQLESLLDESIDVIGADKIQEMKQISDNAAFFAAMVRYAVLNDHSQNVVYSPDLSETLLSGRVLSCTKDFLGRKKELSEVTAALKNNPLLFVTGIAGIGKSEFAKHFAKKNEKKYTNIIYLYYTGSLKKCIAELEFASDIAEMTEAELFEAHYKILQTLYPDSLIIIDNFNVLPKDDVFFREFVKNRFQILITTRCKPTAFNTLEIKELNKDKELCELFYRHCPSSKSEPELVAEIIDLLNAHTLTVSLAALTLEASGMDIEEFLYELKTTGIRTEISEEVELYKDETFSYGRMMEQHQLSTPCDKALLLDFKAELFVLRKEFANALKKRLKAIQLIEAEDTTNVSVITLHSNLYNNLSNTYLYLKKIKEATAVLKKAFEIRKKYEHLGLMESHDTLQQIGNLANMLIIGKEYTQARGLLSLYESLISEYENEECLDYGFCQTMFGILCYREGKATEAERHLLSAETIISDVMGTDNDYMKTVYRYLHSLYTRWKKPELAQKYKGKYLESSKNKLKISP